MLQQKRQIMLMVRVLLKLCHLKFLSEVQIPIEAHSYKMCTLHKSAKSLKYTYTGITIKITKS
ncbi:hypothetical protein O6H91_17G010700 [Diphasiastrum complanatum]|uniref:Uncharacterized protein n=2 Tax=Diphasiastrum complanatum TaxID=34168 RepID=A0ACC2B420_DIPCM|nr:hypothetical protein O6H91_17G009700 [Diphasiastrum complanatum]KAJ7524547.1 hypothetical protein O6H91_17G010700 [Diphasiastrum complanatum]